MPKLPLARLGRAAAPRLGAAPPRLRVAPAPRSGSDGGYPWSDGELLYAADLNAAISGATNYTATGGTVSRAAQDRAADVLNIRDYILTTDPDATAGFGRIMAQVQTLNRPITVYVPSGTYHISAPIAISLANNMGVTLKGDGSADTLIYQQADADGIDVTVNNWGSNNLMGGGFTISGLTIFQASGASTTRKALSVLGANVATGMVGIPIIIDDVFINTTSTSAWWGVGIYLGNTETAFISRVQSYCRSGSGTTHLVLTGNALGASVYNTSFNLRDCFFINGQIGVDLQNYLQGMHFYNLNTIGTVFAVNATPTAGFNEEYQFVGCYLSGKVNLVPSAANMLGAVKFVSTYFDSLTMTAANDTQVLLNNVNGTHITNCTFNGTATRLANIVGLSITGSNPYEIIIANNYFGGYQSGGTGLSISSAQRPPLCIGNSFLNVDNPVTDTSPGALFMATRVNYVPYLAGVAGTGVTVPSVTENIAASVSFSGISTFTGNVYQTGGGLILQGVNQALLMGSQTAAGTPYINFFSSGNSNPDARIIATGGTGNFDGNLTLYGNFQMQKATTAATAPTANTARLRFEPGTNTGTAKLVAYAGTSATGVTIMDNIGAGF